jgi:TctA family transporter
MFPSIIAFSIIGTYSIDMNTFHVYEMALFGALGYVFGVSRRRSCSDSSSGRCWKNISAGP